MKTNRYGGFIYDQLIEHSREKIIIKNIKNLTIGVSILVIIILFFTFFEYILLKILGIQYDSALNLILFFIIYIFLASCIIKCNNA